LLPPTTSDKAVEGEPTITVKSLLSKGLRRVFIIGILPLSFSSAGSVFNVGRNVSFHKNLAGLCGLTDSDIRATLKES
jgi:hypothetical protein